MPEAAQHSCNREQYLDFFASLSHGWYNAKKSAALVAVGG